jgi:hypothetical protein
MQRCAILHGILDGEAYLNEGLGLTCGVLIPEFLDAILLELVESRLWLLRILLLVQGDLLGDLFLEDMHLLAVAGLLAVRGRHVLQLLVVVEDLPLLSHPLQPLAGGGYLP